MRKVMVALLVAAGCLSGTSWADRSQYPRYTPRTAPRTSVYVPPVVPRVVPRVFYYGYGYPSYYGYSPFYGGYWGRGYGAGYAAPYWLPVVPPAIYVPEQPGSGLPGTGQHPYYGGESAGANGGFRLDPDGYWVPAW